VVVAAALLPTLWRLWRPHHSPPPIGPSWVADDGDGADAVHPPHHPAAAVMLTAPSVRSGKKHDYFLLHFFVKSPLPSMVISPHSLKFSCTESK